MDNKEKEFLKSIGAQPSVTEPAAVTPPVNKAQKVEPSKPEAEFLKSINLKTIPSKEQQFLSSLNQETAPVSEEPPPPVRSPAPVTTEVVKQIGQQYNLTPDQITQLDNIKEFLGQQGQDSSPAGIAKQVVGTTSEMFLLGIPQWLYKKYQDDPNMRAALDTMQEKIDEQKSWLQFGSELGGGLGGAFRLSKAAAGLGGKAAKVYDPLAAVGSGATLGLTESKEGEELQDAAVGAAIGAGAVVGVVGVGALYRGTVKLPERLLKREAEKIATEGPQLDKAIKKAAEIKSDEISAINKILLETPESLKDTETFVKTVSSDIREKLVAKEELNRFINNPENSKLLQVEGKPLPLDLMRTKAIELISESKLRGVATQLASLMGETRSLSTIMKETPEFFTRFKENGKQFVDSTLNRVWSTTLAKEAIPEIREFKRLPGLNALQKFGLVISDGKFVSKMIDERLGLTGTNSMELVLDKGAQSMNMLTSLLETPLKRINSLQKAFRKSDPKTQAKLYDSLDSGQELSKIGEEYKLLFRELREDANELGAGIQEITNYVPKLRLPFVEYRAKLNQVIADVLGKAEIKPAQLTEADFLKLKSTTKENRILEEIQSLSNMPINTIEDLRFNLNSLLADSSALNDALRSTSFAQAVRTGAIPDWALDKDVGRLALRWTQNTYKHLAVRETIRDLTSIAQMADKAGQNEIALYTRNLTSDVLGRRKGTLDNFVKQQIEKTQANLIEKAEKTKSPVLKSLYQGAASLVDLMPVIQQQAYPNFLGLNPKSAGQNLGAFFYQNTPELGGEIGARALVEGSLDVAAFFKNKGNMGEYLAKRGILPRQWDGEMVEALKSGVQESAISRLSRKALDKSTKTLMIAFTKSEQLARLQTHFQAKRIAKYIIEDPRLAEKLKTRISSATYRNLLQDAIDSKNLKLTEEHMDRYLQSTNLFNYDKINMSEYGRVMGPLFSMFSKWPTATAGKLTHYYFNGITTASSIRAAQTLFVPFAMAKLYDSLIAPEAEENIYYDKIVGKKGIANWTGLASLPLDISVKDGLLAAPIPSAAMALSKVVTSDNPTNNFRTWLNNMMMSFGPGAGWLRFIGEDLPEYIEGRDFDKVKPLGE